MGVLVCKMAGLAYYYPALLAVLIHQAAANNQTGEDFTVKINQDGVAKRSFCCLFAKDHCSEPCQDKKCSAKCIVECGEDGVFKCPGIPGRHQQPGGAGAGCEPAPPHWGLDRGPGLAG